MSTWKSQQQIDEIADRNILSRCESVDPCEQQCQEDGTGIMAAEGLPFCNEEGKNSLAVDFGGSAELRNGSAKEPIQLTDLQLQTGGTFKRLLAQKSDGTIHAIKPPSGDSDYRLIATKDGYKFELNTTVNEFDTDTIYTSGDIPDFIVGGKVTTNEAGKSVTRLTVYDISTLLDVLNVTCK